MNRKIALSVFGACAIFISNVIIVSAHIVVSPNQVGVAKFQTFNVSVANEKEVSVTALLLVIPEGLKEVTPTVKSGWTVETKKSGGDITEINWTAGSLPVERRDDFTFSAQVPDKEATLNWKAYQTYSDGSVVSWNQTPSGSDDATGDKGPYSQTKIVNDLVSPKTTASTTDYITMWAAFGALVLSLIALVLGLKKSVTK